MQKKVRRSFTTGGYMSKNGPSKAGAGRKQWFGLAVISARHIGKPHGGHQACHGGLFVFCIQISGQTARCRAG